MVKSKKEEEVYLKKKIEVKIIIPKTFVFASRQIIWGVGRTCLSTNHSHSEIYTISNKGLHYYIIVKNSRTEM